PRGRRDRRRTARDRTERNADRHADGRPGSAHSRLRHPPDGGRGESRHDRAAHELAGRCHLHVPGLQAGNGRAPCDRDRLDPPARLGVPLGHLGPTGERRRVPHAGLDRLPLDQSKVTERVPVVLSPDVTLASGTIKYFPTAVPTDVRFLATNVSGAPGATLATLDTTMLANGAYVIQLDGTDDGGNQKTSVVLVTVTGDYKPGRLVVELTDFTLPI